MSEITADGWQVCVPLADLRDAPDGRRQRQLLFGETVDLEGGAGPWRAVRAHRDGYRGMVKAAEIGPAAPATHKVAALGTHLYAEPDMKSPDLATLSFGARLRIVEEREGFGRTREGRFVPLVHCVPLAQHFADPASVAEMFLGTPYLWGGNSRLGIDCSGLVQAACLACGISCPGDSADQARSLGAPVDDQVLMERNDLLFWAGHVAIATGADMLVHANAHHMAVVYEPAHEAVRRIARQGGGSLTQRRRLRLRQV